jgi:hypothetical protein
MVDAQSAAYALVPDRRWIAPCVRRFPLGAPSARGKRRNAGCRATDTLDGVLVSHITQSGHFPRSSDATYGPDGGLRAASLAGYSYDPFACDYTFAAISNGTIYSSGGIVRSAQDGHVVYQFDPAAGAHTGAHWLQEGVAANGGIAVFTWTNYQVPTSTVTALDGDGGMLWQHTLPHGDRGGRGRRHRSHAPADVVRRRPRSVRSGRGNCTRRRRIRGCATCKPPGYGSISAAAPSTASRTARRS